MAMPVGQTPMSTRRTWTEAAQRAYIQDRRLELWSELEARGVTVDRTAPWYDDSVVACNITKNQIQGRAEVHGNREGGVTVSATQKERAGIRNWNESEADGIDLASIAEFISTRMDSLNDELQQEAAVRDAMEQAQADLEGYMDGWLPKWPPPASTVPRVQTILPDLTPLHAVHVEGLTQQQTRQLMEWLRAPA